MVLKPGAVPSHETPVTPGSHGCGFVSHCKGLRVPGSAQRGRELFAVTCVEKLGVEAEEQAPKSSSVPTPHKGPQNRYTKDKKVKFMFKLITLTRPPCKCETKKLNDVLSSVIRTGPWLAEHWGHLRPVETFQGAVPRASDLAGPRRGLRNVHFEPVPRLLCQSSVTANYHTVLGCETERILFQFWRPGVQSGLRGWHGGGGGAVPAPPASGAATLLASCPPPPAQPAAQHLPSP